MENDFNNLNFFEEQPLYVESVGSPSKAYQSDGFFVLLKPNCYYQDGAVQTDFVAYNISLNNVNLTDEVLNKLNVCPSRVLQSFQSIENQMYSIKPLIEQEIS